MLKRKNYSALENGLCFVAKRIDQSTEYKKKALLSTKHTPYSQIGAGKQGNTGQQAQREKELRR